MDIGSKCGPAALYKIKIGPLRPQIPYFIIWSEIIFFWNISDHDVGSPPWNLDKNFSYLAFSFWFALFASTYEIFDQSLFS